MTRIYLVDDHEIMRDGLRSILEAGGHTVLGDSGDPTQALADLQRLQPDLLLLDLNLGERSGFELLQQLQRRSLAAKCIILTSSTQVRHVVEAIQMGAVGYVLKDAPGCDLLAAIDKVMQGKKHFGGELGQMALLALMEPQTPDLLGTLSPREKQIIALVVNGHSSAEIGAMLHLSPKTVGTYRSRLMQKLGVNDLTSLVRLAIRLKLIDSNAP